MRTLVDAQPEALWQAAAELAGYPSQHPVRSAPSVRAWLRQQHIVHCNLASGASQTRSTTRRPGVTSPDHRKHVRLSDSATATRVKVSDLLLGTAHHWQLPERLGLLAGGQPRCWSPCSTTLALTWGRGWGYHNERDDVAGLVFISLATRVTAVVTLPLQWERIGANRVADVCSWSSSGLLVQHDDEDGADSFSVLDCTGSCVAVLQAPAGYDYDWHSSWSLSGRQVLLTHARAPCVWIWDVAGPDLRCFDGPAGLVAPAWSPASDQIMFSSQSEAWLLDVAQGRFHHQLDLKPFSLVAWGLRGLVVVRTHSAAQQRRFSTWLHLYQVQSGQLVLAHKAKVFRAQHEITFSLSLAPDGCHLLLGAELYLTHPGDGYKAARTSMRVMHCMTGAGTQLWSETRGWRKSAHWSTDGVSVLIDEWRTDKCQVLDFS